MNERLTRRRQVLVVLTQPAVKTQPGTRDVGKLSWQPFRTANREHLGGRLKHLDHAAPTAAATSAATTSAAVPNVAVPNVAVPNVAVEEPSATPSPPRNSPASLPPRSEPVDPGDLAAAWESALAAVGGLLADNARYATLAWREPPATGAPAPRSAGDCAKLRRTVRR